MPFVAFAARTSLLASLIGVPNALAAQPLVYEFNSPLYDEAENRVTVVEHADFGVAVHNPPNRPALRELDGAPPQLVGQGPAYATADELDGITLKGQRLSRWYFRIPDSDGLEIGKRYSETVDPADPREESFERHWWIENLEVAWRDGDNDGQVAGLAGDHVVVEVRYDHYRQDAGDDSPEQERVESRRDFWFADRYPFSPLQFLPHRIVNDSRFVFFGSPGAARVNDHIYRELLPRLREAGMLVRTNLESGAEPVTIALQNIEAGRQVDISRYREWPRIPESREDNAVGALMMKEMLGGAPSDEPGSELTLPVGPDGSSFPATASFKVTDRGDAAIAASFGGQDGVDGMVLLLRAHHGLPGAGEHVTAPIVEQSALRAMSAAELRAYAEGFNVFAVLEDSEDNITTFTSTGEGAVHITASQQGRIAGEFDIEVEAVELYGNGRTKIGRIRGHFDADRPLKGRLMSPVSQILRMKR